MHAHRDMEIITYMLEGELTHQDSMGNKAAIPAGDVQRMSAGSGVSHSEFNHAHSVTHLLQIWLEPHTLGVTPSYAQKHFGAAEKQGRLRLLAAPVPSAGAVAISADAALYSGLFEPGQTAKLTLSAKRKGYVHLVRGELAVNGTQLLAGDAALLQDEADILLSHGRGSEVLVFDLAA
jgi:hypothetical protein